MAMMAAQEAVVELLRREGVEYVFGIPGAAEILFVDALERAEMREAKTFFRARKGGSMGFGLPGALGVKLGPIHGRQRRSGKGAGRPSQGVESRL